jgi:hypothetical protein
MRLARECGVATHTSGASGSGLQVRENRENPSAGTGRDSPTIRARADGDHAASRSRVVDVGQAYEALEVPAMNTRVYDVAVVGGGAAGFSAALVLGCARRQVSVIDAGTPRNAPLHTCRVLVS